ncbi:hypothetical protein [Oerskovia enterophila]|uniref:hypothetical protein n=1 Tax=Oerskovia enterophila TaxID=43678 RepID=UPI0038298BA1
MTSAADVAAAPEDCDLLGAEQVTALAGRALDGPRSVTVAGADGMPACLWGDFEATAVQVARVPAEDWAQQLPAALEQAEASGMLDDAENTRKIREASELISAGGRLDAGQACAMFSTMLEISGTEAGLSTTINLVPTQEAPQAISAQSCNVGVFSSVLVVKDGITGSDEEIATVGQALALVEEAEV